MEKSMISMLLSLISAVEVIVSIPRQNFQAIPLRIFGSND